MERINGQGNEITLIFPEGRLDCISSGSERFNRIINQANISVTGNNNPSLCASTLRIVQKSCCLVKDSF